MPRQRRKKIPKEPVTAQIDSLSHDGRGIAHLNGKTVFIFGALPGETVTFRYQTCQSRYDEGIALEITNPAPERITPKCPHFGLCGGCSLQHLGADQQISLKQATLLEQFRHLGNVEPDTVMPPLQANIWGYRHKARLGVRYVAKKAAVLVGFREQKSAFLAELSRCEVLHPSVGERITQLREVLAELSVRDKIAQIEVAVGDNATALVLRNLVPLSEQDCQRLSEYAEAQGLFLYLQPGNVETVTPLYPVDLPLSSLSYQLTAEQVGFTFAPHDFTQVNPALNQAMQWLNPSDTDTVLDLFCGLGNFTLPLAKRAAQVVGVEGEASLIARAKANAEQQGIHNVTYHVANLAEQLTEGWLTKPYDKILLDPPRSGALEIIQALPFTPTQRIVYVSCNPATLARDAGVLVHEKGYRLRQAGVMDMFPHTAHVESMALFEK